MTPAQLPCGDNEQPLCTNLYIHFSRGSAFVHSGTGHGTVETIAPPSDRRLRSGVRFAAERWITNAWWQIRSPRSASTCTVSPPSRFWYCSARGRLLRSSKLPWRPPGANAGCGATANLAQPCHPLGPSTCPGGPRPARRRLWRAVHCQKNLGHASTVRPPPHPSCPTAPTVVRDAVLGRQVGILGGSNGCARARSSYIGAWDRQSGRCGLQRVNL